MRALDIAVCVIGVLLNVLVFILLVECIRKLICSNQLRIKEKHIFVHTIEKGQKKKRIKKKHIEIWFDPFIRFGTIFSLLCYLTASCGQLAAMFIVVAPSKLNLFDPTYLTIQQIRLFMWYLGRIVVNFVFTQRLQSAFKDTPWKCSKQIFYGLCLILLWLVLLLLIMSVIRAIICAQIADINLQILLTFHICFSVSDVLFWALLTALFHKKVFELIQAYYVLYSNSLKNEHVQTLNIEEVELEEVITAQTSLSLPSQQMTPIAEQSLLTSVDVKSNRTDICKHISESVRVSVDGDDLNCVLEQYNVLRAHGKKARAKHYKYGHTQRELINSMVQYSSLISVCVIASISVMISGNLENKWFHQIDESRQDTLLFYGHFWVLIHCFISSLCLYLQFPFALRLYRSLCCAHNLCLGCVTKCVEKL